MNPSSKHRVPSSKSQTPVRPLLCSLGLGASPELGVWCFVFGASVGILVLDCPQAPAAEPTPAQIQFFENRIRPILVENCYKCHSRQAERPKGGLLLDSRDALLQGGANGPVIAPGDPEKSSL